MSSDTMTLMPVRLTRRRAARVAPATSRRTHVLPQAGAGTDRTLCGRAAAQVVLDEGHPTCVRCLRAIARHIAAGTDVSLVTTSGTISVTGVELP